MGAIREGRLARYGVEQGLPKGRVYSLHEEPDGTLWLATANGLARFKDGRIVRFPDQRGLDKNAIFNVIEDRSGALWFNSPNGIFRVSKSDLHAYAEGRLREVTPRVFGSQDGVELVEFTGPTLSRGCRTRDGRLWFPTAQGAAVVDPQNLIVDRKVPPVIEKVVTDGRPVLARDGIEIPADVEKVEIHYTALSFTLPERVSFRHVLEGFDRDWVHAGNQRVAHFTKLPPGTFRFRVRAANSDGVWSEAGASLSLSQQPRFHQTVWFRGLVALGVLLALLTAHRLRVRRLEAHERELSDKVKEAVAKIKVLTGLLPLCANCKKVRNDVGDYVQIDTDIRAHSDAQISHGICPECIRKLYPGYGEEVVGRPRSG